MQQTQFKVYGYRWVVLLAFMAVAGVNQLLWITFASITTGAVRFYGVSDLEIGILSLIFMLVYIIVSVPASWAIDTWGIRAAVGIGAALTGVFGLLRGLLATSYTGVLIAQIGIAVGQPFILNAITTVAARWFPLRERATAAGFGSLAAYLGILLGLALTPFVVIGSGIAGTLLIYGIASVIAALIFIVFVRENPPTPPCAPEQQARSLVFDGLAQMLRQREFLVLLPIFFVGLGVFNAVTTWVEEIVAPRGFTATEAGIAGGLMIVGGIVGALIVPALSDRARKRIPFIVFALAGAVVGLIGLTFAGTYALLLASSFLLGFFLLTAGPIGFQYGAEITYPAPEGTSNGLLLMMGQISGVVFILGMDIFKAPDTGAMTLPLAALTVLLAACLLLAARLKESKLIGGNGASAAGR
ncbi:MAG: MFS transporter [Chloroflexi bacterium]|nr:MFS transporter [Chloroflexota bacterium]